MWINPQVGARMGGIVAAKEARADKGPRANKGSRAEKDRRARAPRRTRVASVKEKPRPKTGPYFKWCGRKNLNLHEIALIRT